MKIALVGSSGYIAEFLLDRFSKYKSIESVLKIDQSETADAYLNLQKPGEFNYTLLDNIDFVIFTAAISSPDKCAMNFDLCWDINVIGTSYFIQKIIDKERKVLFFSSDAVFGDISGEIYTENSITQAQTPYGIMKKAVEDKFKWNPYFKVIRLSYVVSAKDKFVSYCFKCIEEKTVADIFHPFYRNCIVIGDVVNVVIWFLEHWDKYKPFVLNVAGKELISRVRIADEINRILNGKLKYTISIPKNDFYKNRPCITQMKSLYMQKFEILEDNTFTEKIRNTLSTNI